MTASSYRLYLVGLPEIKTIDDFALMTRLSKGFLFKLWKFNGNYYKTVSIPKSNGELREISCPSKDMKAVQGWILRNILNRVSVSEQATAYIKKTNLLNNVFPHRNNRYFLCMDLKSFFPSIKYSKVYSVFKLLGYTPFISHFLTGLCTKDGVLPQGAVTSPCLSNIVCIRLDRRISGFTGKRNITYTRYADDLIFSGMNPNLFDRVFNVVRKIIEEDGYEINSKKTRILGPRQKRKITGLVVSDDKVGVGKVLKSELRAKINNYHYWKGSEEEKQKNYFQIQGWFSHLRVIDPAGYQQLKNYDLKRKRKSSKTSELSEESPF